ncbi:hypothetical protein [Rhizobium alarense]|nr:hypothetical protein [Rhizobium alarense]
MTGMWIIAFVVAPVLVIAMAYLGLRWNEHSLAKSETENRH